MRRVCNLRRDTFFRFVIEWYFTSLAEGGNISRAYMYQ